MHWLLTLIITLAACFWLAHEVLDHLPHMMVKYGYCTPIKKFRSMWRVCSESRVKVVVMYKTSLSGYIVLWRDAHGCRYDFVSPVDLRIYHDNKRYARINMGPI